MYILLGSLKAGYILHFFFQPEKINRCLCIIKIDSLLLCAYWHFL